MIKDFKLFEATLKDSPGIPSGYIEEYSRKMSSGAARPEKVLPMVGKALELQKGHEEELEELGIRAVKDFYGEILDNVEIDAKIVIPGEDKTHTEMRDKIRENQVRKDKNIKKTQPKQDPEKLKKLMDMMKKAGLNIPEKEEKPQEKPEEKKNLHIEEDVAKRKIINSIIQGESFNCFGIINLIKNDIDKINPELFKLYKSIIEESYKFYWMASEEEQVGIFMKDKLPMGNFVQVDWGKKKEEQPESEESTKQSDEDESSEEAENLMDKSLDGNGIENNPEEAKEVLDNMVTPKIVVRALDLPAMIHETVKGIYELIAAHAIGEDKEKEKAIATEVTSYADEIEDLRYGPKIASDVRDFLNLNPNINKYPNIREFVFGKMVTEKILSSSEFLKMIKGILSNKSEDADLKRTARIIIDRFVTEVINEMEEYEEQISKADLADVLGETEEETEETNDEDNIDDQIAKMMASTQSRQPKTEEKPIPTEPKRIEVKFNKIDKYSDLTEVEFKNQFAKLNIAMNNTLDDGDMKTVKEIGFEMAKLKEEFKKKYDRDFVPRSV